MEENTEKTTKTKTETAKIEGVSAQINLGAGSETHRQFAEIVNEAGLTARDTMRLLMQAYRDRQQHADDGQLMQQLQDDLARLRDENDRLRDENDRLQNTANENAMTANRLQLQIDGSQLKENQIVCDVHPVAMHFLREMAERTGHEPSYILVDLFLKDLQNPRSNNLPYVVTTAEIRKVIEELKAKKEGE